MGRGEKSIFWYWEIDRESQQYRQFQAIDLAAGEGAFQNNHFDSGDE